MRSITLHIDGPPPSEDGAKSIRSADHRDHSRVLALREQMREALLTREPFERVQVRLEMRLSRCRCKGDALNLINGVADVIQRVCHREEHRCEAWLIDDDSRIREFHYEEEPADRDRYVRTLSKI